MRRAAATIRCGRNAATDAMTAREQGGAVTLLEVTADTVRDLRKWGVVMRLLLAAAAP